MTRRTRLFLLGSGGILVIGLGTGVVASYMGLQNVVIGGDGPSELEYVPQDAKAVAFANVREVLDSELRNKLMNARPDADPTPDADPDTNDRDGFFEATGLDIEKDVDSLVASLSGNQENQTPLVVARGRFNNGLIESAIMQHAPDGRARVENYRGTRMIVFRENDRASAVSVAFAEPGLIVLGPDTAVQRALDAKASGNNVIDNAEVMKLVRDSDDGNAWAVARFDALAGSAQLPQEIASHLPAIAWVAAKGHINGGLRAVLRAETRDDASAQNLREVIRGFMALARLQAGQRVEFTELLNSFELGGTGKTVSLGFAIDPAIIDTLSALSGGRGPRPPTDFSAPSIPAVPELLPPPPPLPPLPPLPAL